MLFGLAGAIVDGKCSRHFRARRLPRPPAPIWIFGPPDQPIGRDECACNQKGDFAVPSAAIRQQTPAWPIPVTYGVYAISEGQLNELEPLGFRVPDPRVFMSATIKSPSRTNLPDGRVVFIAFRRDIATTAPDRVTVRVIARIARAMTFNSTSPAVTPLNEEWTMRSTSYELRVAPVIEQPEMVLFRPESPELCVSCGPLRARAQEPSFRFHSSGPITDPAHCLERTEAANGAFYSECRNP